MNMAVWHTTDREDNQYLCLQVEGFQHNRCSYSLTRSPPAFTGWEFVDAHPIPKSSTRFKRSHVANEEACVHWQLPAVELDHRSHDCFFWSLSSQAHVRFPAKGHFQGHKNQMHTSNHCPGVTPELNGIRGQGSYQEIANWCFQLPFSLTLWHLVLLL